MKLAIVGSRDYFPLTDVESFVRALPKDTIIISGGAKGVDTKAEQTARLMGMEVISFPARWEEQGVGAGMIRNLKIVEAADKVVAFWDLKSRGTAHTIMEAAKRNKLQEVKVSVQKAVYIASKLRGGKPIEPHLL